MRYLPPLGSRFRFPSKDPKKFWVGTTLEPYGLIYQPKLLQRFGVTIKDWDDLLNPKLKGQIAQCTPDRSSSSHASYEVILAMHGWDKGWDWLTKLAANTGIFTARSRDVPSVVAKGEFAVGSPCPAIWHSRKSWGGMMSCTFTRRTLTSRQNRWLFSRVHPHPKAGHAFIEFLLGRGGPEDFCPIVGVFPITPKYEGSGSRQVRMQEKAVQFTAGIGPSSISMWETSMTKRLPARRRGWKR